MPSIDAITIKSRIAATLSMPITRLADERLLADVVTELKRLRTVADLTTLVVAKAA